MRKEKQLLLDEIKDQITSSGAMIVTRYRHFAPDLSWSFRSDLKKNKGTFEVVKKRVFLKAAKEAGISINISELEGHIGLIFAQGDGIETTKTVFDFIKNNEGSLGVICGRFDNQLYSSDKVEALSKLPSKNEMRSQLLGLFEAPISQTLSVMESLLTSVLHCLENKSQKESEK